MLDKRAIWPGQLQPWLRLEVSEHLPQQLLIWEPWQSPDAHAQFFVVCSARAGAIRRLRTAKVPSSFTTRIQTAFSFSSPWLFTIVNSIIIGSCRTIKRFLCFWVVSHLPEWKPKIRRNWVVPNCDFSSCSNNVLIMREFLISQDDENNWKIMTVNFTYCALNSPKTPFAFA